MQSLRLLLCCVLTLRPFAGSSLPMYLSATIDQNDASECSIRAEVSISIQGRSRCPLALGDELFCGAERSALESAVASVHRRDDWEGRVVLVSTTACGQGVKSTSYDDVLLRLLTIWSRCGNSMWVRRLGGADIQSCENSKQAVPTSEKRDKRRWLCSPLGLCGEVYLLETDAEWFDPVRKQLLLTLSNNIPAGQATSNDGVPQAEETAVFSEIQDAVASRAAAGTVLGTDMLADAAGGPGLGERMRTAPIPLACHWH